MATKAKAATKSEILRTLSEKTGLQKKDVSSVLEALDAYIRSQLGKRGPGVFTLPGLVKLTVVTKPATKARMGRNPATGEPMMIKAKPARKVVRARPLKVLKDSVLK